MMAYENDLQGGARTPGAAEAAAPDRGTRPKKPVNVKKLPNGIFQQETDNIYMIPIAFAEVVVLIVMIVMNYLFRFNESVRDSSSLADYKALTLSASDVLPPRPYFNYSKSLADNQHGMARSTFGITFTMEEYAFFVPLFIFPLLLILLVEIVFMFFPRGHLKMVTSFAMGFNPFARRSMRIYYVFLFYASLTGMVTSFIKLLVAKPRPHFWAVCSSTDTFKESSSVYIFAVNETCENKNWSDLNEALRSFPSYHATIAFYAGTFLVLYLMYTTHLKGTYSTGGMFSLPVMVMAIIGGLHRWCTYHADGWDVAWGAAIGIVGALWAVHKILNCFQERVWALNLEEEWLRQSVLPPQASTPSVKSGPVYQNPAYSVDESVKVMQSSPRPDPYADGRRPSRVQRIPVQAPPPRSPAQAFNSGFVSEPESPRGGVPPYNLPRQRYSVPAIQMQPMPARPSSAHPGMDRRPMSRYEGASYF